MDCNFVQKHLLILHSQRPASQPICREGSEGRRGVEEFKIEFVYRFVVCRPLNSHTKSKLYKDEILVPTPI